MQWKQHRASFRTARLHENVKYSTLNDTSVLCNEYGWYPIRGEKRVYNYRMNHNANIISGAASILQRATVIQIFSLLVLML